MKIYSKAAVKDSQIKDRKLKGSNFCEIHLTEETNNLSPEYIYSEFSKHNICPTIVHSPFNNKNKKELGLGQPNQEFQEILKKSINIAHYISTKINKKVYVIGHTASRSTTYESVDEFKENFIKDLKYASDYISKNNLNVCVLVENHAAFNTINEKRIPFLYGISEDYIKDVNNLNLKHIGILIDLCHYLGMRNYYKSINKEYLSLDEWFKLAGDKLRHIHFCGGYGFCDITKNHGCVIEEGAYLEEIIKVIKDNNYKYDITLEVLEKDIDDAKNYKRQLDILLNTNLDFKY